MLLLILLLIAATYSVWLIQIATKAFVKENNVPVHDNANYTIIIPFKNEEHRIFPLLESLAKLDTARHEILLIDDHSTDKSIEVISKHHIGQIIRNEGSGKKAAIQTGVKHASNVLLFFSDADAILPLNWMDNMYGDAQMGFVIGPVYFKKDQKRLLNLLQRTEQMSIQVLSSGSTKLGKPITCSGASLSYSKAFFNAVGGFKGNEHIASGDDVFMLQKAIENKASIKFCNHPNAIVYVEAAQHIKELIQQRIRWGAKTKHLNNSNAEKLGIMIFLGNLSFVLSLILLLVTAEWYWVIPVFLKITTDLYITKKGSTFFNDREVLAWFLPISIVFPFYITLTMLASQLIKPKWVK